jgi:hypothetical protein
MRGGEVWGLKTWERHTVGNASGASHGGAWPTPIKSDDNVDRRNNMEQYSARNDEPGKGYSSLPIAVRGGDWQTLSSGNFRTRGGDRSDELGLDNQVRKDWATPQEHDKATGNAGRVVRLGTDAGGRNLTDEVVHGSNWTTPQEDDANNATRTSGVMRSLTRDVMQANWPSPNAFDSVDDFDKRREANRVDGQGMHSVSLRHMVDEMKQWATPIDSDYKGSVLVEGENDRKLHRLNPDWEELLMTWPCGWTDPTKPCAGIWPGHAAGQGPFQYNYEPPRTVHRDKSPNRTKRVSAIGNGVVTACAELAYYLLLTEPVR